MSEDLSAKPGAGPPLLQVDQLSKHFGGLSAVSGVSFTLGSQELLALIGPNGAGKTTLFNLITGFLKPSEGRIYLEGEDITGLKPHQIARKGIVRTFQLATLFGEMTALENVILGLHMRARLSPGALFLSNSGIPREEISLARELLEMVGLTAFAGAMPRDLPLGHQKRLALALALAGRPKLLLLDEPVAGMTPEESRGMMLLIASLRQRGHTILLVEHNMRAVMSACERIIVLNFGKKIAEGPPEEIRRNQQVIEAYLGAEDYA